MSSIGFANTGKHGIMASGPDLTSILVNLIDV
jgi:hypothetical protein